MTAADPDLPADPLADLEPVRWTPEYSVGSPEMDRQHQGLLQILNELLRARGLRYDSEPVSEALQRMTAYAKEHFQAEERLMEERGYPGLPEHQAEHQAFLNRTVQFCLEAGRKPGEEPVELMRFLRAWWLMHILREDRAYGEGLGLLPAGS